MEWQVPVIQFNWDSIFGLEYAMWVDERTFSFDAPLGQTHLVSLNDNGNLTLDDTQNVNQARSYSPHRQYIAECSASDISLYRLPERHLVGSASMAVPEAIDFLNCDQSIQWAPDDSALMLTIYQEPFDINNHPKDFYLWNTNQPKPRYLATASFENLGGYISPDFKHLMVIRGRLEQGNNPPVVEALLVDILNVESGEVNQLRLKEVSNEIYPNWLTDEVIVFRIGNSTYRYFNSQTGELLFQFYNSMGSGDFHQYPSVSPDQRWVTLDTTLPNDFYAKRYSLYDLQTKTNVLLAESPSSRILSCGWKPDSSLLYLVNSPNKAFSPLDSPLPAGMIAYNPRTQTTTVLVPDAVRAFWSPDMKYAWVIRQSAASNSVVASLFDAANGKLSGNYFVSTKPVEGDPARDFLMLDFELHWAHDSTRALLVNANKELFLLTGSEAKLLANNSYHPVNWSPDDRYALVYYSHGAWVVDLSKY